MAVFHMDIKVLGGLPVTVSFDYCDGNVENWEVTHIASRACKKSPKWLYDRIEKTKGEEQRLIEKLYEYDFSNPYEDY